MHPSWFFRGFEEWDPWDRELLPLAARSPALDLGAGAGRASLWLQEQGVEVTAVDSSPGAVEVCRARGVRDVRLGDLRDPPTDRRWRAILLLCGNLGLGGSWDGTRRLLTRLAEISAADAVLVADTVDPNGPPDIGLRLRWGGLATPWWPQRNLPVAEVAAIVDGTGWVVDRHIVELPDHAVLLRHAER
jgi:SAM-dependent methyltransferase